MEKLAHQFHKFWGRSKECPAEALNQFGKMDLDFTVRPSQTGSSDPSWTVVFRDRSSCHIGNPFESVFDGFVMPSNFDLESTDWGKLRRRIEDRLRKDCGFLREVGELFCSPFFGGQAPPRKHERYYSASGYDPCPICGETLLWDGDAGTHLCPNNQ
jgi:hypothetical protein